MTSVLFRVAQAEAQAHARFGAGGEVAHFGPLTAVYAGPDLPVDSAWHSGGRAPTSADLTAFEAFSAAHGTPATLHVLSPFAPETLPLLRERGYALDFVLHAYIRDLRAGLPGTAPQPPTPRPDGLHVTEEPDADRWAALAEQGFGTGTLRIMRLVGGAAGTQRFVASLGGVAVASAATAAQGGVAGLHGMSTVPGFRGRGAQGALLAHRVHAAAQAGADLATVFVTPGSGSERNVTRAGFTLAGARLTFTRG